MHICIHHLDVWTHVCASLHLSTCKSTSTCARVDVCLVMYERVCEGAKSFGLLTHCDQLQKYLINFDFESVRWSHFMFLSNMNNALSWIECNGIYLWKRWLYSFKVSLGIEAASNQLKLTPANHQNLPSWCRTSVRLPERIFKGPRILTHLASWRTKKKNTSDLSLYCDHIFLLWLCSELSKVSFCWSWTVRDHARPSSAILYIKLVLTVFNNVHDCYLLL